MTNKRFRSSTTARGMAEPKVPVRESILDATDRLLARCGYKKMTIDDLAKEVGIGKGSVYLHFASKEEIALSHIDRIIERIKRRSREIAKKGGPVDDRLCEMLVDRVLFRFDSVQHYTQSLNEMLANLRQSLLVRRKRYFQEEARIFAEVILEGQKDGVLRAGDPLDHAFTLLTATNSLLPYSLSVTELGERKEIEDRTVKIASVLIRGLMA